MNTKCIPHEGAQTARGYGCCSYLGRTRPAHRVAYVEENGLDWADIVGLVVMHTCDNPVCVNPDHLRLGTQADNMADMASKGRSTLGSRNPNSRMDEKRVRALRKMHGNGVPQIELARKFGIHFTTVCMIVNRKTWQHV